MEKLLKKYKSQLVTLKENKKQASKDKKYPYDVAIEIVEDFIKDLKRVMAKGSIEDSNCTIPDVINQVCDHTWKGCSGEAGAYCTKCFTYDRDK